MIDERYYIKIHETFSRYGGSIKGQVGIIVKVYCLNSSSTPFAVRIHDKQNHLSSDGVFWLNRQEFDFISEEDYKEAIMHKDSNPEEQNGFNDYETIVGITFLDNPSKTYQYACYDPDIKEGDLVAVMSAHHGMGIARVTGVVTAENYRKSHGSVPKLTREIVSKIDDSVYKARVEKRKAEAELIAKMEARAAKLDALSRFRVLAESDPEMATLLAQYTEVQNK